MTGTVLLRLASTLFTALLFAQQPPSLSKNSVPAPPAQDPLVEFVCPMDPDVRALVPGKCPRCGMALVAGIPEATEYPVDLISVPGALKAGAKVQLEFSVRDPKTGGKVTDFNLVHEKLYHMFIVSQDLQFFLHDHPLIDRDGIFRYDAMFPKPGMYRVLNDFYPKGGTPQMIVRTLIVPGCPITAGAKLQPDLTPKKAENLTVELRIENPIAGMRSQLYFKVDPAEGLEPYLGAWGHMLAVSEDLVDMLHTHPFWGFGGAHMQFRVVFPRPGVYRVWVQLQRNGVVNTAVFNVPVSSLDRK